MRRVHQCRAPLHFLLALWLGLLGLHPTSSPPSTHPSKYEGGSDDIFKEDGGGFHFGAFLCPAEAIGWRGVKEAGQIAAGSVPPLEPGDAAQWLSLCWLLPEPCVLLRFLLWLRLCCYLRT